ncbi:MAG: hypothetical protein FJ405_09205 [Verrucomicrobia bacterium]|nr:hypothetical protein [Verrucomicrobiota bacterium]
MNAGRVTQAQARIRAGEPFFVSGSASVRALTSLVFLALVAVPLYLVFREFTTGRKASSGLRFEMINHKGWSNSWLIANGKVEVVVVPEVGRVMQFRFAGGDSPFWENPSLHGKSPDPKSADWGNFGGDKTWPAPQSTWPQWTPRAWPPPPAFDSMPVEAERTGDVLVLRSPVDPYFGIRTLREIRLDPVKPQMTIVTTYDKMREITDAPIDARTNAVSIWIITQLAHPVAVFAPIPKNTRFPEAFDKQSKDVPPSLKKLDGLLSIERDSTSSYKIGNDADSLVWVGEKSLVRIDSPRGEGDYPDNGSSAEIYTNPDPLAYVELELLGPLRVLKVGDRIYQTNTYTLYPRRGLTPEAEAREVLGIQ